VVVIWPDQREQVIAHVKANQLLKVKYEGKSEPLRSLAGMVSKPDGVLFEDITTQFKIPYKHEENQYFDFYRESLMPFMVSTEGPAIAVGDANGDGLDDMYLGGGKWQTGALYLQKTNGQFAVSPQVDFRTDSTYEDVDATFFDANRDGFPDLYVVSGGNEFYDRMTQQFDRLYLNVGKGNFKRSVNALPAMYDNKSCVRPFDIDGDGDLDLFVGGRIVGFQYGVSPNSYLLINDGKGHFTDKTNALGPGLRKAGMVTDAVWADIDGDKLSDLIVVGDWMPVKVFLLQAATGDSYRAPSGLWQCIRAADFDNDGDIDLVAGNIGSNNKFKKTAETHLKMWVKDFDDNKGLEQVLAYNVGERWYPVAFKDELGKRIPSIINKRFTDYKSFAGKTISEIFKENELKGSEMLEVEKFESIYLENKNGSFVIHDLPREAQVSKLFALTVADVNNDGKPDLLGGGNFLGVSMYQGRYDSSYGLVLVNDGRGNFQSRSVIDSGFLLDGEIRGIRQLKGGKGPIWVVAANNLPVRIFKQASMQ
jgi:hypothetical protein